jgi:glyoxylase-like metal-dependent hydrolase (beta-lactamase superfamily II)
VPAAGVLFAGDLVEQGAPPDFTDADPLAWPSAMDTLLAMAPDTVVPGHGEPVDRAFVAAQRAELDTVATLCRAVADGTLTGPDAVRASPYPEVATRAALLRVTGTGAPG